MHEIVLAPLAREDVAELMADSLHCDRERATPLAELVHEKTAGNPFFVIQFLSALVDEGLLTFDHGTAGWSWDLARIRAKEYTDNVVDLMVGKLCRLPDRARKRSCSGSLAWATAQMSRGWQWSTRIRTRSCEHDLQEALRSELVLRIGRFLSFPPRPRSGSRLLTDPGNAAR